jgi:hypothetical protein
MIPGGWRGVGLRATAGRGAGAGAWGGAVDFNCPLPIAPAEAEAEGCPCCRPPFRFSKAAAAAVASVLRRAGAAVACGAARRRVERARHSLVGCCCPPPPPSRARHAAGQRTSCAPRDVSRSYSALTNSPAKGQPAHTAHRLAGSGSKEQEAGSGVGDVPQAPAPRAGVKPAKQPATEFSSFALRPHDLI